MTPDLEEVKKINKQNHLIKQTKNKYPPKLRRSGGYSIYSIFALKSNDSLRQHGFGDFQESCHIGSLHIIDITISLSAISDTLCMNF